MEWAQRGRPPPPVSPEVGGWGAQALCSLLWVGWEPGGLNSGSRWKGVLGLVQPSPPHSQPLGHSLMVLGLVGLCLLSLGPSLLGHCVTEGWAGCAGRQDSGEAVGDCYGTLRVWVLKPLLGVQGMEALRATSHVLVGGRMQSWLPLPLFLLPVRGWVGMSASGPLGSAVGLGPGDLLDLVKWGLALFQHFVCVCVYLCVPHLLLLVGEGRSLERGFS